MRTKTLLISGTSALLIAGTILVSCQKSDDLKSTTSNQASERASSNVAFLENLITKDDADQTEIALALVSNPTVQIASLNCQPTTTYDNPPGVYPRTVTVDFGAVNCYQPKTGLTRRGKTVTTYFGDMADTASTSYYIQTYDNYYVNDVQIEGSVKVAHNSRNKDPQNVYRYTYNNRKATQVNGDYIIMNGAKRLVKQVDNGEYPGPIRFGSFRITGIVNGDVLEAGVPYQYRDSIDEANPLIYDNCEFAIKGNLIIDFTNHSSWFINYGNVLTCDDQAELTVDGNTQTITLPFFRTSDY